MASCQTNFLAQVFGRKSMRLHAEVHQGACRATDGQKDTLPAQALSLGVLGVSATNKDGSVISSSFVWGSGETQPPVKKDTSETDDLRKQIADLEARLTEAAALAAEQAASVDTSDKDEQIRTLTAEITEYQSVIEELEAPKAETPAPAVVSEDPAPEADVHIESDLDALSERELMSMSFD